MKSNTFNGSLRAIGLAAMLTCAAVPGMVRASTYQPGGLNLGASSFHDGFGGLEPGWATVQLLQFKNNDKFYDNNGNKPGTFRNPKLTSFLWLPQIAYTSPIRVFGGALGFTVLLPVMSMHGSSDAGSMQQLTARSGVGDIIFGPYLQMAPVISGGRPVFSQRFEFDVIAPTGAYNPSKLANPSSGFWSLNPHWAMTFLPTAKTEISLRLHYLYNFSNHNPGVNLSDGPQFSQPNPFVIDRFRAGQAVWVNFTASYKVLPNLNVGINGFWFRQITDDTVDGRPQTGFRTTNLSIGPGAQWTVDNKNFVFMNIYLPVSERNTYSGFQMGLRWIHAF
ncbi:hypothetical protein PI93_021065 [Pandoraea fibrosis]|uniref:Phenol degradation protein meta n=1 Tax=Pandoraea fibrosis TaxID=1891094 RepID=A0ABX6HWC7_9BURK|nr:transporter [Pandoraea fibrosis]QHE91575.1 hypothetical protein PJ20_006935 [Pandoraea fibrosis]QHF14867.1 hypothetical protein PI93_021065 [Pandoraea fibrosis]